MEQINFETIGVILAGLVTWLGGKKGVQRIATRTGRRVDRAEADHAELDNLRIMVDTMGTRIAALENDNRGLREEVRKSHEHHIECLDSLAKLRVQIAQLKAELHPEEGT